MSASAPAVHELTFGQSWNPSEVEGFQPATVHLRRDGEDLELEARLTDAFIRETPQARFNDFAYTQGDVFELFIKAEGDLHYHEIHVTPGNVLLQLRFKTGAFLPFNAEAAKVTEPLLDSSTERTAEGWVARFRVPLGKLTAQRPLPRLWRVGCGRYDYRPGRKDPVISNTAPLTVASFHRYWEWPVYDLG